MAGIEVAPLQQWLSDDEIDELQEGLREMGVSRLPRPIEDASQRVASGIDEDALAEFLDRLEAHEVACEIYLPAEFEGVFEVGDLRVGSVPQLVDALEDLRDELSIDDEDELDDEDEQALDDEQSVLDAKLRRLWRDLHSATSIALERQLPIQVR